MFSASHGKPGVMPAIAAAPREVFAANRSFAQFIAGPATIDGRNSGNPANAPYPWVLWAGTLLGRLANSGRYAPGVIGPTTASYAHAGPGGTTLALAPATAAEVARRVGPTGTLKLTGPATPGGPVATQVVAYSAVNPATGQVTLAAAAAADAIAGSFVQAVDGSEVLVTVLCDAWGVSVADPFGGARVDAQTGQLLAAGGTLDVAALVDYPADPGLRAWVKAAIRNSCPGVNFSDDIM